LRVAVIDVLCSTVRPFYIISTPQNIAQNSLAHVCRSILRFSPTRALGRNPTTEEVDTLIVELRRRTPKVLKKHFLSFRQFGKLCREKEGGARELLRHGALLIDESHELFNDKVCPKEDAWGKHGEDGWQPGWLDQVTQVSASFVHPALRRTLTSCMPNAHRQRTPRSLRSARHPEAAALNS
jgi:hypothetical protein